MKIAMWPQQDAMWRWAIGSKVIPGGFHGENKRQLPHCSHEH
jgi:hypothetical protein